MVRFIHTADWQIGKPYARVDNPEKRTALRQQRIAAVRRIGDAARTHQAAFVLVAGDLFDTATPEKSTVSALCQAVGSIACPVYAIPGNHDHAGPGSIWEQTFFLQEQAALAPNFRLLDKAVPLELDGAVLLPCPLLQRHDSDDVTAWLRDPALLTRLPSDKPRIVLAHGSTQGFSSGADGEESACQPNLIALERLDAESFDYIALGDWHGTKQVGPRAWYSGTPELDRFVKGGDHDPGNILLIELPGRGQPPGVTPLRCAQLGWHEVAFPLAGAQSLENLKAQLEQLLAGRVDQDLLHLTLSGGLGLEEAERLQELCGWLEARLLRLKLDKAVTVWPTEAELLQLTQRGGDPLISAIATRLATEEKQGGETAIVARRALLELYLAVRQGGES